MEFIHPDVITCAGRWIVEPIGVYIRYSGITTNQSEGFNTVIKRLTKWKEAPVDTILLCFYQLQNFYYNEIQRGFCQTGEYVLCPDFICFAQPPESVQLTNCILPEGIVARAQSQESGIHQETPSVTPSACNYRVSAVSQLARAKLVIAENRVSHDPKLGVFVVKNSQEKPNAVTLFPKQSCTCPSTSECYHILAAKLSLNLPCSNSPTTINLSQLRKNTRSRKGKKLGWKKPNLEDCTIVPVPDSLYSAQAASKDTQNPTSIDTDEPDNPIKENRTEFETCSEVCSLLAENEMEDSSACTDINSLNESMSFDLCMYRILSSTVPDVEMLRLWDDLSAQYRTNYREDTSHEYIEVNLIIHYIL